MTHVETVHDGVDWAAITWITWVATLFTFTITMGTIIGNIIVLMAFVVEKKLRTTFNILILNLAITDVTVAIVVMTLFSAYTLIGWWPFGEFVCGLWIFTDYGMTFASKFTMVAISLDRCWCVLWSIHYRQHNTTDKILKLLVFIWTLMFVIWLPPLVVDRLSVAENRRQHMLYPERNLSAHADDLCIWDPIKNLESVVMIAIVGNHAPDIIIFISYVLVLYKMKSRVAKIAASKATESGDDESDMSDKAVKIRLQKQERIANDKRCFVTLSYIILSYAICWLPFHVTFDVMAIYGADSVNVHLITWTFWMAYFNSFFNPLVYAFCNREFRAAFKRVVTLRWSSRFSASKHGSVCGASTHMSIVK